MASHLPPSILKHCLYFRAVVREFQQYQEPGESAAQPKRKSRGDDDQALLPLGENTLTHNLGLPLVVVVTKVASCC